MVLNNILHSVFIILRECGNNLSVFHSRIQAPGHNGMVQCYQTMTTSQRRLQVGLWLSWGSCVLPGLLQLLLSGFPLGLFALSVGQTSSGLRQHLQLIWKTTVVMRLQLLQSSLPSHHAITETEAHLRPCPQGRAWQVWSQDWGQSLLV